MHLTCWPTLTETKIFLKVGKSLKQGSLQTHRKFGWGPSPQPSTKLTLWYLTRAKIDWEQKERHTNLSGIACKAKNSLLGKRIVREILRQLYNSFQCHQTANPWYFSMRVTIILLVQRLNYQLSTPIAKHFSYCFSWNLVVLPGNTPVLQLIIFIIVTTGLPNCVWYCLRRSYVYQW